jgi:hypothetical protein
MLQVACKWAFFCPVNQIVTRPIYKCLARHPKNTPKTPLFHTIFYKCLARDKKKYLVFFQIELF